MSTELTAAIVAATVSLTSVLVTSIWSYSQLKAQQQRWERGFSAELRRDIIRENTLDIVSARLKIYGEVWQSLEILAGYRITRLSEAEQVEQIQLLADQLTTYAYGTSGMLMSDRSRAFIQDLRTRCGEFLKANTTTEDLQKLAHLLRHSLRADLGISNHRFSTDLERLSVEL